MKRIINSIMVCVLGALAFAACTQDHIEATFDPSQCTAPTLGNIAGTVLAADGEPIAFTYDKATFNLPTSTALNLYVDLDDTFSHNVRVTTTLADGIGTMTHSDLNLALMLLGVVPDEEVTLAFALVASLAADNGQIYFADGSLYSNVVSATFVPYEMTIPPTSIYEHVWVLGDYNDWSHDTAQHLYDYDSTGNTYTGIIDFNSKAAKGFKITGAANWDNETGNWGVGDAPEKEAKEIKLKNGGGNIEAYSKRFYQFTLNTTELETPTLTVNWSADQISIIGLNGDWDTDIVMSYNSYLARFYADIEAPSATEMKFRADGDWALNWGVDCENGGKNIPVEAGNTRVYFNPAAGTYEFAAYMYGQPEPGASDNSGSGDEGGDAEDPAAAGYGLVGAHNGWGGDGDDSKFEESEKYPGGALVTTVALKAGEEFKVRFFNDGDWKAPGNMGTATKGQVATDTVIELTEKGENMTVAADDTYDVYLYPQKPQLVIVKTGDPLPLGIIGSITDWSSDKTYESHSEGVYSWKSVELDASAAFKIRLCGTWNDAANYGLEKDGDTVAAGATVKLINGSGSKDIKPAEAGKYDIEFNATTLDFTMKKAE